MTVTRQPASRTVRCTGRCPFALRIEAALLVRRAGEVVASHAWLRLEALAHDAAGTGHRAVAVTRTHLVLWTGGACADGFDARGAPDADAFAAALAVGAVTGIVTPTERIGVVLLAQCWIAIRGFGVGGYTQRFGALQMGATHLRARLAHLVAAADRALAPGLEHDHLHQSVWSGNGSGRRGVHARGGPRSRAGIGANRIGRLRGRRRAAGRAIAAARAGHRGKPCQRDDPRSRDGAAHANRSASSKRAARAEVFSDRACRRRRRRPLRHLG